MWGDNRLCSDIPAFVDSKATIALTDQTSLPDKTCLKMTANDSHGQWNTGYYLCQDLTIPGVLTTGAPSYASCANDHGVPPITNSCAAEVFNLSPEIYLWNQPAGGGGVTPTTTVGPRFDAITSLPPIL
jgi:hypothetical protein